MRDDLPLRARVLAGDFSDGLTEEERRRRTNRLREMFGMERKPPDPLPAETLDELERDRNAGRDQKFDLRVSPEEKLRWTHAARALNLSASEFVRDCVNSAAAEILADEELPAPPLR